MPKQNPFDLLPGLRKSLFFPLKSALDVIEERFAKIDAGFGLTVREVLIMFAANERQTPQGHLASVLGINKNIMVKLIDRMEENGLVRRVRNPQNRRGYLIANTPKGKKLVLHFRENRERYLREVFHPLSLENAERSMQWACEIICAHYEKR